VVLSDAAIELALHRTRSESMRSRWRNQMRETESDAEDIRAMEQKMEDPAFRADVVSAALRDAKVVVDPKVNKS
jgi:hypothetical protein